MTKDDPFFTPKRQEATTSDQYYTDEEIREISGLRPSRRAHLKCLRCDSVFYSRDKIYNRLCPSCREIIQFEEIYLDDLPLEDQIDTGMLDEDFE
jgi:hypothetical protein